VLISIAVPTINKVRVTAWAADTKAQITGLAAAVERYHGEHRAYPGVFTNRELWDSVATNINGVAPTGYVVSSTIPVANITGAENLVLALLGGLRFNTSTGIEYDPSLVGQGPRNLSASLKSYPAYIEKTDLSFRADPNNMGDLTGFYQDSRNVFASGAGTTDTDIPEFIDRFPNNRMPILYYRANIGGANAANRLQYDLEPNLAYTGSLIGVSLDGKWPDAHGLQDAGSITNGASEVRKITDHTTSPIQWTETGPGYNGAIYFRHPQTGGLVNATGTPRQKDGYILISAGKDRTYGTTDDITSFGAIE
jgi:hypothetical protein